MSGSPANIQPSNVTSDVVTSTRSKLLEIRHWPPTLEKTFLETCDALLLGIEERDEYALSSFSLYKRERENTDQWKSQGK
jgi:hypothetical protein